MIPLSEERSPGPHDPPTLMSPGEYRARSWLMLRAFSPFLEPGRRKETALPAIVLKEPF